MLNFKFNMHLDLKKKNQTCSWLSLFHLGYMLFENKFSKEI